MSRRDYELVARALKRARDRVKPNLSAIIGIDYAAQEIAKGFTEQSRAFDASRFYQESGASPPRDTSNP